MKESMQDALTPESACTLPDHARQDLRQWCIEMAIQHNGGADAVGTAKEFEEYVLGGVKE